MRTLNALCLAAVAAVAPTPAWAQSAAESAYAAMQLAPGALNSGDTAWVLISAALVLLMAMPGKR